MNEVSPQLLDQIIARINGMSPKQRAEHEANVSAALSGLKFIPSPGPQTDAYHCKADILLYGGEGGGGKSALICGLALTQHKRSLIMRRQYTDLSGLTEEAIKMNGTRQGFNGSIPPTLRADGRLVEFGAAQRPGDEESWMGRPHDLIAIDEAWQMLESQVRFLIGWLRSTELDQRCRVILATNPPLTADGEWLVPMFAPWLDPGHPNPAKQGELRHFVTNDEGKDFEVESPGCWKFEAAGGWRKATEQEEIDKKNGVKNGVVISMSRTFIRASVRDNPFLANTDYASKLDSLPPALRASLRDGNFMAGRKDSDRQVIPSAWVAAAQARWRPYTPEGIPMCAIGADVSGGGTDPTILAPRYDGYYPILTEIPGKDTPNGDGISGHILKLRTDSARIGIDMGGGYGNLPFKELKNNGLEPYAHKGNESSTARTRDGVFGFANKRSEIIWKFAEELDPNQPGGSTISLPPDPVMVAELCAARYDVVNKGGRSVIQVESKDEIKARLGRSPNRADAVQLSQSIGVTGRNYAGGWKATSRMQDLPKVNLGRPTQHRR